MKRTFEDLDEFFHAITGLTGRVLPIARLRAHCWISRAHLAGMTVQRLYFGGRMSLAGHATSNLLLLPLPMSKIPAISINGEALGERSICVLQPGQSFLLAARPGTQCIGIALPETESELKAALTARRQVFRTAHAVCDSEVLKRLRALIHRASVSRSSLLPVHTVARIRREILSAVIQALDLCEQAHGSRFGRPPYQRNRVMSRCLSLIAGSHARRVHIADLCRVAQVSERTLRNIFREYFGVGPIRLLKARKLDEIRAALRSAQPDEMRVRCIVGRFGVRDYSLFSRHYRALFGESPSTTLQEAVHERKESSKSWASYVLHAFASRCFCLVTVANALAAFERTLALPGIGAAL